MPPKNHIDKLPDDIIPNILTMINYREAIQLERTDKRFRQICQPEITPIRKAIINTNNQIRDQEQQLQEHQMAGPNPSIGAQVNTRAIMGLMLILGSSYLLTNHSKQDSSKPIKSIAIFCAVIPSLYFYYLFSMRRCCSLTDNSITHYSNFNQRYELTRLRQNLHELFDTPIINRNNIPEDQAEISISDEEPRSPYEQLDSTENDNTI
jgi:hypothetical protein